SEHNAEISRITEQAAHNERQHEQTIDGLREQLAAAEERAAAGEARGSELAQTVGELETSVRALEAETADRAAALTAVQTQLEQQSAANVDRVAGLEADAEAAAAAHQAEASELKDKLASLEDARRELEARARDLEAQLAAGAAEQARQQQRIGELEADVEHSAQVRSNIQAKHDALVAAQRESHVAVEKLKEQLAAAHDDVRGHAAQLADTQQALADEQRLHADVRGQCQSLEAQAAQLARDLDAAKTEHADVRGQLETEQAARAAAEAQHGEALASIAELEARNARLGEELQIEAQAAKEAFEELAQEHHDLERTHGQLAAAHERLNERHLKAIASTQAWLSELQDASARQQAELAGLGEQVA
ncbi:hypothetical protein IWW54_006538, partial [Coemansia sp. RSA 2705]